MITHLTHPFLQNINWLSDQGLQIDMINGVAPPGRNHFYDRMISQSVRDRRCIDIGFGTGLLSVLAIKHGAAHVEAWEMDEDRYRLGVAIIQRLNLRDKITLHHGRFNAGYLEDRNSVIMHEIIGANIWNEGLRQALPLDADVIIPARLSLDFDVILIDPDDYQKIFFPKRQFSPGVETLPGFKDCVQDFIDATPQMRIHRRDYFAGLDHCTVQPSTPFYDIDFQHQTINGHRLAPCAIPSDHAMYYRSAADDQISVLYPRITVHHGSERLHWGWYDPLLINRNCQVRILQDFNTGQFTVDVID